MSFFGGGGGGGDVDTGGMNAAAWNLQNLGQESLGLAKEQIQFGKDLYGYGKGGYERYTVPILDEFMRILGFGGAAPRRMVPMQGGGTDYARAGSPQSFAESDASYYRKPSFLEGKDVSQLIQMASPYPYSTSRSDTGYGTPYFDATTGRVQNMPSLQEIAGQDTQAFIDRYGPMPPQPTMGDTLAGEPSDQYKDWLGNIEADVRTKQAVQEAMSQQGGQQSTTYYDTPGYTWGEEGSSRYVSPMESHMFQLPTWVAKQQEAQSRNALRDITGLGPVSGVLGEREIGRATEEMLSTGAFGQVTNMINSALSGGTQAYQMGLQGYGAATGSGAGLMGMAGQMYGQAGNLQGTIAQMQAQANAQQAQASGGLWGGILGSIGSIGGMLLGGPLGGALGGSLGAGTAGALTTSQTPNWLQGGGAGPLGY